MGGTTEAPTFQKTESEIMHKADVLVIQCIDLRFQEMVDSEMPEYGKFDRIAWPGASKDFGNVKHAAEISLSLHNPGEVHIYEHETCGAYGDDDSIETHRMNAEKLKRALLDVNPDLKVKTLMATFDGIKDL